MDPELTKSIELIVRAQKGEREALDSLFSRYYYRVRQVVRRRVGQRLQVDVAASDLVQDAMLEAFKGFDHFELRNSAAFMGWLAKIVENRICSANRHAHAAKRDRAREVDLAYLAESTASGRVNLDLPANISQPLDSLERDEEERQFSEALEALPSKHRELLLARDFERMSWSEVAERVNAPGADAARMSYQRAKVALKRAIDGGRDKSP
ncbi:MAG: RNA polymerase sigma-70 factor (subfamily 1) [Chlamydiales bacterium]|jgi:RNA polymerase sigma-70 factor (subfamily 1)